MLQLTEDASSELDELSLCDEFLKGVGVAHGCVEIMAVHHAMDDAVDEASERLQKKRRVRGANP